MKRWVECLDEIKAWYIPRRCRPSNTSVAAVGVNLLVLLAAELEAFLLRALGGAPRALARGVDVLLVDTAGRLHTQGNLMRELTKIKNVVAKKIPGAPHEVLLVLDATSGQNAINQARAFGSAAGVTGIFLAKLDGTARGGIVVAIRDELDVPVKLIGVGERPEDVQAFDPDRFVEAMFEE